MLALTVRPVGRICVTSSCRKFVRYAGVAPECNALRGRNAYFVELQRISTTTRAIGACPPNKPWCAESTSHASLAHVLVYARDVGGLVSSCAHRLRSGVPQANPPPNTVDLWSSRPLPPRHLLLLRLLLERRAHLLSRDHDQRKDPLPLAQHLHYRRGGDRAIAHGR